MKINKFYAGIIFLLIAMVCTTCTKDEHLLNSDQDFSVKKTATLESASEFPDQYFPRREYTRGVDKPQVESRILWRPDREIWDDCFEVVLENGDETGNCVSSAIIKIDGEVVFSRSDFQNQHEIITSIYCNMTEQSVMEVEIGGTPGSQLTVWIMGRIKSSGTFVDARDGQEYRWVRIGEAIWMAENLNYGELIGYEFPDGIQTDNGVVEKFAFDNDPNYLNTYGGLYQWDEMMDYNPPDNNFPSRVQGICPEGWHIPSWIEWENLAYDICCDQNGEMYCSADPKQGIGIYLKSTSGWYYEGEYGNGTDDYGFSALPGGEFSYGSGDPFKFAGGYGYWWSTSALYGGVSIYRYNLGAPHNDLKLFYINKMNGYCVRCIKDKFPPD